MFNFVPTGLRVGAACEELRCAPLLVQQGVQCTYMSVVLLWIPQRVPMDSKFPGLARAGGCSIYPLGDGLARDLWDLCVSLVRRMPRQVSRIRMVARRPGGSRLKVSWRFDSV